MSDLKDDYLDMKLDLYEDAEEDKLDLYEDVEEDKLEDFKSSLLDATSDIYDDVEQDRFNVLNKQDVDSSDMLKEAPMEDNNSFDGSASLAEEALMGLEEQNLEIDSLKEFVAKQGLPKRIDGGATEKFAISALSADELTFKITCEIGAATLSLAKLSTLKVGDCIDFMRWPGKVKLKMNDYLFAEGYLVEVQGMLGVKITNNLNLSSIAENIQPASN